MPKDQVEAVEQNAEVSAVEQAAQQVVVSKIKVTFVMEIPDYLKNQQTDTDFIRNKIEETASAIPAVVLSVDIASVD